MTTALTTPVAADPTGMPLMVRNEQPGPTHYTYPTNGQQVTWEGNPHPAGGHIQEVPAIFMNDVHFRKAVHNGIFHVLTEEEKQLGADALIQHAEEWQGRLERQRNASQEALEMSPSKDLFVKPCLGPGVGGRGQCNVEVPTSTRELQEKPPLCPNHKYLKDRFIPEEGMSSVNGVTERVWTLLQMEPRQRLDS